MTLCEAFGKLYGTCKQNDHLQAKVCERTQLHWVRGMK